MIKFMKLQDLIKIIDKTLIDVSVVINSISINLSRENIKLQ